MTWSLSICGNLADKEFCLSLNNYSYISKDGLYEIDDIIVNSNAIRNGNVITGDNESLLKVLKYLTQYASIVLE